MFDSNTTEKIMTILEEHKEIIQISGSQPEVRVPPGYVKISRVGQIFYQFKNYTKIFNENVNKCLLKAHKGSLEATGT